jgi:hypothetical protein
MRSIEAGFLPTRCGNFNNDKSAFYNDKSSIFINNRLKTHMENSMSKFPFAKYFKRILLFIVLLVIHYVLVVIPVLETFLLYIIIFKPKWFEDL